MEKPKPERRGKLGLEKKKRQAKEIAKQRGYDSALGKEEPSDKVIGKIAASHGAECSCWMCGNPRRFSKGKEKLTFQERQHSEDGKEELNEKQ